MDPHLLLSILAISIALQFFAAALATRLIPLTGQRTAWMLAFALALMGVRRCLTLWRAWLSEPAVSPDPVAEIVALTISLLLVAGTATLSPAFIERVRAHRALRESEERFRSMLEHSLDVIVLVDERGIVLYRSPSARSVLGYSSEDRLGQPVLDLVHPEDRRAAELLLRQVAETPGVSRSMTTRVRHVGGDYRFLDVVGSAHEGPRGRLQVLLHARDVTDRVEAEARATHLGRILDESLNEIYAFDAATLRFVFANRGAQMNLGYSRDELYEMTPLDVMTGYTRESFLHRLEPLKKGRTPRLQMKSANRRKDGTHYPVEIFLQLGQLGSSDVVLANVLDVSDKEQIERERERLEAHLRQAQKLETIGTLSGGIAHDFNNILTPILGYSEMAAESLPEDSQAREALTHVATAAKRAKELVYQILAFSRQVEHERAPVVVAEELQQTLTLLRATLPSTIQFRRSIDVDAGLVLADPIQLQQIVMNLCANANHAMRHTGGVLAVVLDAVHTAGGGAPPHPLLEERTYVRLTVSDTGHGMDERTQERIFEPFFTTKGVGEGSGLGLSVVHGIVSGLGGYITVDSEIGTGTTFRIYLPRVEASPAESPGEEPALRGGERILYVDDEAAIARLVEQMLEPLGYDVVSRTNPLEALELFRRDPTAFDVVITDQTMPQITGVELARELHRIEPTVPVILTTGFSENVTEDDCEALGIRGFIMKPIVARALSRSIRGCVDEPGKGVE